MEGGDMNQDIFNALCEYMADGGFQSTQTEFMEHHYKTFDPEEENKLEYTNIHDAYIQILETVIEQQL